MAIRVIWYPPVDQQTYDAVRERVMQAGAAQGMQMHAAGEAEGSWRIFEVWESRDGLESFMREDLHPAIDEANGGQAPPPEPELVFDLYFQGP
jgi:quinol monooxygenase YgiN